MDAVRSKYYRFFFFPKKKIIIKLPWNKSLKASTGNWFKTFVKSCSSRSLASPKGISTRKQTLHDLNEMFDNVERENKKNER